MNVISIDIARTHLAIELINAGVKSVNPLPKADLYIDCRGIANPFHEVQMNGLNGDNQKVQDWVIAQSPLSIPAFKKELLEATTRIKDRRQGEKPFDRPFVVCCLCAHGIHRSRAVKHILAKWLKLEGWKVETK